MKLKCPHCDYEMEIMNLEIEVRTKLLEDFNKFFKNEELGKNTLCDFNISHIH